MISGPRGASILPAAMPWWKILAREPLAHFVVLGAALFAVDAWTAADDHPPAASPPPAAPPIADARSPIVIDAAATAQIAEQATRRHGRAPTAAELADETERWIDQQVLFREAIARGLERDDPMIHERIASRMRYVLEQGVIVPEPSDAELRAWFDAHRDRWAAPPRIDFTHVFVAGTDAAASARADQLAAALATGTPPDALGDRFAGGRRYRGRRVADLAQAFGDEFVDGLAAQPPGAWVRRPSRHGLHLVRVDRTEPGRPADFEAARLEVRREWLTERRGAAVAEALRRLRAGWRIERR